MKKVCGRKRRRCRHFTLLRVAKVGRIISNARNCSFIIRNSNFGRPVIVTRAIDVSANKLTCWK
jgi:hypothetical protein